MRLQGRVLKLLAVSGKPLRAVYGWVEHVELSWASQLEALGGFLT
jgi:hypothetical protein